MVRDLGLTSKDHILVAHPFDGLVLAPLIQKLAGCRFTVLVHDLHADSLERPEIQAGMAAASSVLCVSDALADAVHPFNSHSDVLLPSPGEPMGLAPTFSRKPLALAGGFNDQYLALASKLREPIIAIGENPGGNYPTATFVPRFAENDDAVRFVSTNCSAVVVIVPHEHGEYASHSFPSKLLDFARCGLPMVIIAPPDSPVGRWAAQNKWCLLITDEDDDAGFLEVSKALAAEQTWLAAQCEVLQAAEGPLSAAEIHAKLLKSINSASDSVDLHREFVSAVAELA